MFSHYELNIFDFDIYSKRISFFYNKRDKIGTIFGLVLTFLYASVTIFLFSFYLLKTIKRKDVKSQESTVYSKGLPSINVNRNLLYFAFGLENPISLNRFIDERIYNPKVFFIQQKKENGILVTKEEKSLNVERCDVRKFGEEYQRQFTEGELNNSYCLNDINLTLVGGSKYEKSSFIQIKIHPCTNSTDNNNHCKPQNVIDSYLTSGYFSITIIDIGLNPSNYSFPVIPIIQNLKTNVDITMCRESLIYMGITEVHTDIGLFSNLLKIERFLEYRKYSQSFFFINETEYHNGKEIFGAQIKLEEYIHVLKREYTKLSEIFSITGGYMQLISTLFALVVLLTRNFNVEKKILNRLFNFNIKQRKLIISIQYEKNLNYLVNFGKENSNYFVPVNPRKSLNPYKTINHQHNFNPKKNDNSTYLPNLNKLNKSNNTLATFIRKYNSGKANDFKPRCRFSHIEDNNDIHIIRSNAKIPHFKELNHSKMLMLFNDEPKKDFSLTKFFGTKYKKENLNSSSFNNSIKEINEKEVMTTIKVNLFEYFCYCGIKKHKKNIEIFDFGINFYKTQMSIINIFNVIFLAQILVTKQLYKKKHNISNQIIEIPIRAQKS